jgi:hypothetical protein
LKDIRGRIIMSRGIDKEIIEIIKKNRLNGIL